VKRTSLQHPHFGNIYYLYHADFNSPQAEYKAIGDIRLCWCCAIALVSHNSIYFLILCPTNTWR